MKKDITHKWFYNIEAIHEYGIDINTRTIFVHPMEPDSEVDEVMAKRFLKNLSILESRGADEITVRIMTCGGSWDYGMAMYDAIASSPCHITTISYAHARSMSSIIPQAADHRVIMPNAYCMVHWGTDGYDGVAHGLQSYAEFTKLHNDRMLSIYYARCSQSAAFFSGWSQGEFEEFLRDKMDRRVEWWMTAKEAVLYGFMDEVCRDGINL